LESVKYAILETSGQISLLLRSDHQPLTARQTGTEVTDDVFLPTILINDGRVLHGALRTVGRDERWLEKQLHAEGLSSPAQVFLLTLDESGKCVCIKKEERK